jgi:hypothetical protein
MHISVVAVAVLTAFAVACTDDDEPSVEDFIRDAEAADKQHEAAAEPLREELDGLAGSLTPQQAVPQEARDLFRQLFEEEARFASSIEELDVPDDYEDLRIDAVEALRAESEYGLAMISGLPQGATVGQLMAHFESDELAALEVRRSEACTSMQQLANDQGIAADFTC